VAVPLVCSGLSLSWFACSVVEARLDLGGADPQPARLPGQTNVQRLNQDRCDISAIEIT
jgi:hypothetical protein